MKKLLISKIQEVANGNTIDFMVGRDKAEHNLPLNKLVTIENYDYLPGDNGEFAVVIFKEDNQHFYFMGSVVTDKLKKIDDALLPSEKDEILEDGIECVFLQKTSKSKRTYMDVIFFPNEQ